MDRGKEQVQLLLDYGADMNLESKEGRNAIMTAQPCWYEQMANKHRQQLIPFVSVHFNTDLSNIIIGYVVRMQG